MRYFAKRYYTEGIWGRLCEEGDSVTHLGGNDANGAYKCFEFIPISEVNQLRADLKVAQEQLVRVKQDTLVLAEAWTRLDQGYCNDSMFDEACQVARKYLHEETNSDRLCL